MVYFCFLFYRFGLGIGLRTRLAWIRGKCSNFFLVIDYGFGLFGLILLFCGLFGIFWLFDIVIVWYINVYVYVILFGICYFV